jgi:hypothetical protein
VETCLRALLASGQVGKEKGRFVVRRVMTVDTQPSREQSRALKAFWAEQALERMARLENLGVGQYSYNVYAVSERDLGRIRALHASYYNELREIVSASEPPERVVLSQLWLAPLDE